jgi:hypothetical protein
MSLGFVLSESGVLVASPDADTGGVGVVAAPTNVVLGYGRCAERRMGGKGRGFSDVFVGAVGGVFFD